MGRTITKTKLATLASKANESHWLARDAAQSAVNHAIQCGEYLQEIKGSLKHGQFGQWLRDNFQGSERSAQQYMKFASNAGAITEATSQREAVAMLADPKAQRAADSSLINYFDQGDPLGYYPFCVWLQQDGVWVFLSTECPPGGDRDWWFFHHRGNDEFLYGHYTGSAADVANWVSRNRYRVCTDDKYDPPLSDTAEQLAHQWVSGLLDAPLGDWGPAGPPKLHDELPA